MIIDAHADVVPAAFHGDTARRLFNVPGL